MYSSYLKSIARKYSTKLVIHIGTPKTATTSLQHFLHQNRSSLLEQGFCYPQIDFDPPKHQWMISSLLQGDVESFLKNLESSFIDANDNVHTIILSSEGIFNHWYDFPALSKSFLKDLQNFFDVDVLLVFRDQISFTKSYYKQVLKNPKIKAIACYGQDISLSELLDDKWFARHLDYFGFVESFKETFTRSNLKIFQYDKNIIKNIIKYLGIDLKIIDIKNENVSLSAIACDLLRVLNRYDLHPSEKLSVLHHIEQIDKVVSRYADEDQLLSDALKERIVSLSKGSNSKLGLNF